MYVLDFSLFERNKAASPVCSRDRSNIEVRVEIETHPRGARQFSLSSILSSRSLSVESLGKSQDHPHASEQAERRGEGMEREEREKRGAEGDEGTAFPVFEVVDV